jgi:DNA-binding transcriptional LysR family regulator
MPWPAKPPACWLAELLRARRSGERGRVRIGASTTPGLYFLPPILAAFRARHPEVLLELRIENSARVLELVVENEVDLGVTGRPPRQPGLCVRATAEDEILCFAALDHPLARMRQVRPEDLASELCVARERGSATRQMVDAWLFGRRGLSGPRVELRCPEGAKALVRAGLGYGYGSLLGFRGAGAAGLARIRVKKPPLERRLHLALHVDKRPSPALHALLGLLEAAFTSASRPPSKRSAAPRRRSGEARPSGE